jgi:WD40 repeat protein
MALPADTEGEGPYKGLAPYGTEDAAFFFGRERERRIISANLRTSRLTLLYGPSGVGKTSVLHAGVAHSLQEQARQEIAHGQTPRFVVATFGSWQDDPASALADSVRRSVAEAADVPSASGSLVDVLEAMGEDGPEVLLILDQFEECLDFLARHGGEDRFAEELAHALNRPVVRAHFLISLREDALARIDRFKGQIPGLFANYLRIDRLSAAAARAAIEGPLAAYNERVGNGSVEIEEVLVEAVLDQVRAGRIAVGPGGRGGLDTGTADGGIETPYLQLVMTRIWDEERLQGSHVLRRETLDRLGGAGEIVRAHVDEQMRALSEPEQAIAAQVFDRLVTPSGTKLAQTVDDLATYSGVDPDELRPVLEKLSGRGRILRPLPAPPSEPGATRYEIFHDRLAAGVLEWRRGYLEQQERERQVEAERRRTRRLRRLALALIAGIVVIAGVAVAMVLLWQEAQAQKRKAIDAAASELAATADSQIPTDPAAAVPTALRAFEKKRTAETIDVLRSALLESHRASKRTFAGTPVAVSPDTGRTLVAQEGKPAWVQGISGSRQTLGQRGGAGGALSPDGRTAVVLEGEHGAPHVWDLARRSSFWLRVPFGVAGAAFSPDGAYLVTVDGANARIWKARTGRLVRTFPAKFATAAALSRGAHVLVVGTEEGVRVRRFGSSTRARTLGEARIATAVAVSPDGRFVAAATGGAAVVWGPDGDYVTCGDGTSESVSFSRDGRLVVSGQTDGTAVVCDALYGTKLVELRGHQGPVATAAFDAASRRVATTGDDRTERVSTLGMRWVMSPAYFAALDGTGRRVVTMGNRAVRVWDIGSRGRPLDTIRTGGYLNDTALNPGGTVVATATDRGACLWKVGQKQRTCAVPLPGAKEAESVAFDRSGDRVLVVAGGRVRIFDAENQRLLLKLSSKSGALSRAAFSGDGKLVAAVSDDGVVVWGLDRPQQPKVLGRGEVDDVDFSRDEDLLIITGGGRAIVWKLSTGDRLMALPQPSAVSAGLSPDGRLVVVGSEAGPTQLWDWRNPRKTLSVLEGSGGPAATTARFSRNGTQILLALGGAGAALYDCTACGPPKELVRAAKRLPSAR